MVLWHYVTVNASGMLWYLVTKKKKHCLLLFLIITSVQPFFFVVFKIHICIGTNMQCTEKEFYVLHHNQPGLNLTLLEYMHDWGETSAMKTGQCFKNTVCMQFTNIMSIIMNICYSFRLCILCKSYFCFHVMGQISTLIWGKVVSSFKCIPTSDFYLVLSIEKKPNSSVFVSVCGYLWEWYLCRSECLQLVIQNAVHLHVDQYLYIFQFHVRYSAVYCNSFQCVLWLRMYSLL